MPKISVIVPIYNPGEYGRPCIESIVNQTLKDIEIFLIDNGSTDGTKEMLQEYSSDPRVQIIYRDQTNEHCGEKFAVDLGRSKATGEYIIIVDHDDELLLDGLEKLYQASDNGTADVVKGRAIYFMNNQEYGISRFDYSVPIHNWKIELNDEQLRYHFLTAPELWSMIIRRDFQKDLELGDYIYNDTDFAFKLKYLAKDFRYIQDFVYKWNIHEGSTSHQKDRFCGDIITVYDSLENFLKTHNANNLIWELFSYSLYAAYEWVFNGIESLELKKLFYNYFKRDIKRNCPLNLIYFESYKHDFIKQLYS